MVQWAGCDFEEGGEVRPLVALGEYQWSYPGLHLEEGECGGLSPRKGKCTQGHRNTRSSSNLVQQSNGLLPVACWFRFCSELETVRGRIPLAWRILLPTTRGAKLLVKQNTLLTCSLSCNARTVQHHLIKAIDRQRCKHMSSTD